MYYTLEQVRHGLTNGRSFKRYLGASVFDGCEYVRSLLDGRRFEHAVHGPDFGGVAELDISALSEDRWSTDLWVLLEA